MSSTLVAICPEIECESCANAIKRSLGKLDGVGDVSVSVPEKQVTVQYEAEKLTVDALKSRLELAGFRAE